MLLFYYKRIILCESNISLLFICLSTYKNPYIINIEEVIITYDSIHIIMENIPNGAFDKRLLSFPQSQYSTVLNQIISGIDFLHSNSIIHRDIKLKTFLNIRRNLLIMKNLIKTQLIEKYQLV